ncbi:PTS glucose transporter subunit IIA [Salibacterium salarium]|uniref:PTS glucose transporter subunit IIA n=1 Tax=Salibacterium salarium TaxID=284579 RepID=A0A3R9P7N0_9BACI|nr:PTS glucose transporter subunit IIA [Salibacterium salarium]RSL34598.1 PTS glucose transporter subunit IIA [Salibacterium salarium]
MLKRLFGNTAVSKEVIIKSPVSGKYVDLTDIPDPTFSEKRMGDGFAVEPDEGKIVSPINGKIVQIFPSKHAIGIKSEEGLDILIHIGLENVSLKGIGFEVHVNEGDRIKTGDILIEFNLEEVVQDSMCAVTPVVFTEGSQVVKMMREEVSDLIAGDTEIMTIKVKS